MRRDRIATRGLGAVLLGLTLIGGCGTMGVQPWERDLLAQDAMALQSQPVESALDAHIYFSKEASSGGGGFAGGGCGCN
jgi:hypothetical protein